MEKHQTWTLVGIVAVLSLLTLALLALNLAVLPSGPVHGAVLPSEGPRLVALSDAGTPEPVTRLQIAPSGSSDDGTCANPYPIACGEQDSRDTTGHQNNISTYACQPFWPESGPEVIYAYTLPAGHQFTVSVAITVHDPVDLDVFLLQPTGCDSGDCLGNNIGDSAWAYDVGPGTYYISVDGYNGAAGSYTLDLDCVPTSNSSPYSPSAPDPADGATDVDPNAILSWAGGDPDGDMVTYNVRGAELNAGIWDLWCSVTTTSCTVGPLQPHTTYQWYVFAQDEYGGGAIGTIWQFTTGSANNPPNAPSDPSPKDGATGVRLEPALGWTGGDPDVGDTLVYTVYGQLASSVTSDVWCTTSGLRPHCRPPGVLLPNTRYFWQVDAADQKGAVTQGAFWEFTTGSRIYVPVSARELTKSNPPPPEPEPTPTPTPTKPPTAIPPPPPQQSITRFVNRTPYVIVSLSIDGVERYPTTPNGLLPNTYVDEDLGIGTHTLDAYNGFWQDDGTRFTMYWWHAQFQQAPGAVTEVIFEGPAVELLLPDFGPSHRWQGEYWTGGIVTLHYAGFCFYDNGTFRFFLDGLEADTGTYGELYRTAGLVTFRVTNTLGTETFDAVLDELDGSFTMNNGPSDWQLIRYYPKNVACPPAP